MKKRAQGAIEYLLLLGGGIIVAAIILSLVIQTVPNIGSSSTFVCASLNSFAACKNNSDCCPVQEDIITEAETAQEFFICNHGSCKPALPACDTVCDNSCSGATCFGTDPDCDSSGSNTNPCCGNDIADGLDECDGLDLRGESCESLGYSTGSLACNTDCTFDETDCSNCGNGQVDLGERCDGSAPAGSNGIPAGGLMECIENCSNIAIIDCGGVVSEPGFFVLNQDIGPPGNCIKVKADNVEIDCRGNKINGNGGYGIDLSNDMTGITYVNNCIIRNCEISNYQYAIQLYGGNGHQIIGNSLNVGNWYGIYVFDSKSNQIIGNEANGNEYGIYNWKASNNTINSNTANNNGYYGIYNRDSTGNEISGNTANNNLIGGIINYTASDTVITGNYTISNGNPGTGAGHGIYLNGAFNIEFKNNKSCATNGTDMVCSGASFVNSSGNTADSISNCNLATIGVDYTCQ